MRDFGAYVTNSIDSVQRVSETRNNVEVVGQVYCLRNDLRRDAFRVRVKRPRLMKYTVKMF